MDPRAAAAGRAGGGLSDLSEKSRQLTLPGPRQHLPPVGPAEEGVGHALGAEGKPTGCQAQARVADVDLAFALVDVEPFVLVAVDVPR